MSEFRLIISARSYRMFGTELDSNGHNNGGIGVELKIASLVFVEPTRTFRDQLSYTAAAVDAS